jgi:hypothetical protein
MMDNNVIPHVEENVDKEVMAAQYVVQNLVSLIEQTTLKRFITI